MARGCLTILLAIVGRVTSVGAFLSGAAVEEARAQGATWSQVAQALNRTRQAVEARFG